MSVPMSDLSHETKNAARRVARRKASVFGDDVAVDDYGHVELDCGSPDNDVWVQAWVLVEENELERERG